jgi:hypothetical protein
LTQKPQPNTTQLPLFDEFQHEYDRTRQNLSYSPIRILILSNYTNETCSILSIEITQRHHLHHTNTSSLVKLFKLTLLSDISEVNTKLEQDQNPLYGTMDTK